MEILSQERKKELSGMSFSDLKALREEITDILKEMQEAGKQDSTQYAKLKTLVEYVKPLIQERILYLLAV